MTRQCARPGCSATACATLAYDYKQRTTWIDALSDESHPMSYDLCKAHAESLTVPRGWRLEDRRGAGADTAHLAAHASYEDAFAV